MQDNMYFTTEEVNWMECGYSSPNGGYTKMVNTESVIRVLIDKVKTLEEKLAQSEEYRQGITDWIKYDLEKQNGEGYNT